MFHYCQSVINGTKDSSEGDIVGQKGEYMVVEPLIMKEIHCVVEGGCNVNTSKARWQLTNGAMLMPLSFRVFTP